MFTEVLTENQKRLLPFISSFSKDYYLVGGTAIALQIGHRYSIDFNLFTNTVVNTLKIKKNLNKFNFGYRTRHQAYDQLHIDVFDVKLTFFEYPYRIKADLWFEKYCRMPQLLDLAAMKCLALGGKAKWKDYVDLYFLIKNRFTLTQIIEKAIEIFSENFNPKLLRQQLAYFNDIDYREQVIFLPGFETDENEIKYFLTEIALETF